MVIVCETQDASSTLKHGMEPMCLRTACGISRALLERGVHSYVALLQLYCSILQLIGNGLVHSRERSCSDRTQVATDR